MDSLYLNSPRPFNKYPTGYRPINTSLANSRRYGSVSNLTQTSPNSLDVLPNQIQLPYHQQQCSSTTSFVVSDANVASPRSRPYRWGSVGPSGETFSEVNIVPQIVASPNRNQLDISLNHQLSASQDAVQPVSGDEFLEKLRRQKEEIERSLSKPLVTSYIQTPAYYPLDNFSNEQTIMDDNLKNETSNRFVPTKVTPIFKTQSESVIKYDNPSMFSPTYYDSKVMSKSFNEQASGGEQRQPGYNQHERHRMSMPPGRDLDDRYSKVQVESNWMTHPPPPINMDPKPHRKDLNGNYGNYGDSLPFNLGESFRKGQTVVPIKLDDDRILKVYAPQVTDYDVVSSPLTIRTDDTNPLAPYPANVGNHRHDVSTYSSQPSQRKYDRNFDMDESPGFSPLSSSDNCYNNSTKYFPQNDRHSMRIARVNSMGDVTRDNRLSREITNISFPEIPPSVRDNNISMLSLRNRPSPFSSSSENSNHRNSFYGPVSSKVFPGHNRINGFINDTAGQSTEVQTKSANSARERSFAIVSRPSSPQISIENPGRNSSNQLSRQRNFSPIRLNERPLNISPLLNSEPGSPRSTTFSPTSSLPRSFGSPISSYENDSEPEPPRQQGVKWPDSFGTNIRGAQHRAIQPVVSPPHGILVKNHDSARPQKRVVFQCDAEIMDRLRNEYGIPSGASSEVPAHVRAFDDAIEDAFSRFKSLSDQIGGDVLVMKGKVISVFDALRNFLWTAAGRTEPGQEEVQALTSPIVKLLGDINEFKDSKRGSQFNHLNAVAEGIPAVGWIMIKKTPAPYIKDMVDAAMFYINRILKEFKESDPKQAEWAKTWKELLETMQTFVRQTHTTGLVWNSSPGSAPSASAAPAKSGPPPPPAGGPPPPPPPPPANLMAGISSTKGGDDADKAGRDALFAEINKGEGITSKLKKVTADMQTHKNPNLRASSTVTAGADGSPAKSTAPVAKPVTKPPKIELQDFKQWNIEYQVNNRDILINIDDKKQTMYVFKCENCVIQVKGKLNSVTLDNCKKTSIVFDALVAQCETINCQSVQIQTLGEMPTLSIQKTDGCQVYLSEASLGAEIVTSKSSEMNILIPGADGEFTEMAVPEQFKTVIQKGKLVTVASDII